MVNLSLYGNQVMDTLKQLADISSRLDNLETQAEWIARETVHFDSGVCQSATLISVLAEEVRAQLTDLVMDIERGIEREKLN